MTRAARLRWISAISIAGFFATWWAISGLGLIREDFLPSPARLVDAFMEMLRDGYGGSPLWKHVGMSIMRATGLLGAR